MCGQVVVHFLEDFQRHKKYTGFGDCGFTWQKLENRFMRSALSLKSKQQGVLVKKVCLHPFNDSVATDDVAL